VSDPIQRFLGLLQAGPDSPSCVFNPWRDHDERDRAPRREMPARRRDNMGHYLQARARSARVMLLGEAPSHRGCRFTGIAFCSEVELLHKREQVARAPLAFTSRDADDKPMSERSAAILWDEMERGGCAHQVVLWNAFPWHPYLPEERAASGPCGPCSNRKPRRPEVEQGRDVLDALLACFTHPLRVYAVGKVAEEALARWGKVRSAGYLRHPSMGGEARFRSHFREQVLAHLKP
jgi:hypothetical protein